MNISLIAAMANNHVIGVNNQLPWHLRSDLQHFKKQTLGKTLLMGRKTFESIGSKPLPERQNVILTRQTDLAAPGFTIIHQLNDITAVAEHAEIVIIGGEQIYTLALPYVQTMWITLVDCAPVGDAFFPSWSEDEWETGQRESHQADADNDHAFTFLTLQRKGKGLVL